MFRFTLPAEELIDAPNVSFILETGTSKMEPTLATITANPLLAFSSQDV